MAMQRSSTFLVLANRLVARRLFSRNLQVTAWKNSQYEIFVKSFLSVDYLLSSKFITKIIQKKNDYKNLL